MARTESQRDRHQPTVAGGVGTARPGETNSAAARFVQAFADTWARPTADGLIALCHPNVRLAAPMMNTTVGYEECREEFRRILALWPDVHLEVVRWSGREDVVFIELILHATFGGRPLHVPAIDRILLKDGLCLDRVSYVSDPLAMFTAFLTRPAGWMRWWRSGQGPPRRRRRIAVKDGEPTVEAGDKRFVVEEPHAASAAAERFVRTFAEAAEQPTVESLVALNHPNARLLGPAPMMVSTVGLEAARQELARELALCPDVRFELVRWSGTGDLLFIEAVLHATFAGGPVRIPFIDRIFLKDGLCLESVTHVADPFSLLTPLLRPTGWPRLWRFRPRASAGPWAQADAGRHRGA